MTSPNTKDGKPNLKGLAEDFHLGLHFLCRTRENLAVTCEYTERKKKPPPQKMTLGIKY